MSPAATTDAPGARGIPAGTDPPEVPPRLRAALDGLARWTERGVHFAPIRHHSPACALALRSLLEEVRPGVVLIEGPREYAAVLAALQDPRTVPPVAVLSVDGSRAGFYPLAEFSPEWVALRWAGEHGARVEFIDQPYRRSLVDDDPVVHTLQAEHHLARSEAIAALSARLGCRDHDEVWEHLFEDRETADLARWRTFFADVLAWSALARLEATREALDADGTHDREAVMAGVLAEVRAGQAGSMTPIVVVTGAFHTPALLDVLDQAPEARWVLDRAGASVASTPEVAEAVAAATSAVDVDACWVIRYDFERLDSLRGYGAGMPSPGFWQRAWAARSAGEGPRRLVTSIVLDVLAAWRAEGEPVGSATAAAAAEQILRLADLRGRAWPGRVDVLDGLLSTLAKDDAGLSGGLGRAVAEVFATSGLGEIPDGVASPPLVAEVRGLARRMRCDLTDARPKRVSLDTARTPRHRTRREFLARMRFIGCGFARQVGGADLVAGTAMGQFAEEWEYAWTPLVESALIDASAVGPTLEALVSARVRARLSADDLPAAELVGLVAELLVMGEGDRAPEVCRVLDRRLAETARLGAVVAGLHGLVTLLSDPARLTVGEIRPILAGLVERGLATVAYLLPGLAGLDRGSCAEAVEGLVALRDLLRRVDSPSLDHGPVAADEVGREAARAVAREIARLRADPTVPAMLHGALVGLAATDGSLPRPDVTRVVTAHLAVGADSERLADFLVGLLRVAPDVVLHGPEVVEAVSDALTGLSEGDFLAVLPDLRSAFTFLKPTETHRLAQEVARLTGATAYDIDVVLALDPETVAVAHQIESALVAGLVRDGLGSWVGA